MRSQINSLLAGIAVGAFVVSGPWVVGQVIADRSPPAVFEHAEFMTETARPDDTVPLKVKRTLSRACESAVINKFWRRGNRYVNEGYRPSAGEPKIGTLEFVIDIVVPDDLEPGVWCYSPTITYTCSGVDYSVRQGGACLLITDD